jgi:hypothetical protein
MSKTKSLISSLILLLGGICFAQDAPYPDVWWRQVPAHLKGFGIRFLAVEKAYELNPSESPEIYIVMEKRPPNVRAMGAVDRVFAIQGFFSGRQWRVKHVDFGGESIPERFQLDDGHWLDLVKQMHHADTYPALGGSDKEVDGPKPVPPAKYLIERISAFGSLMPGVDDNPVTRWVKPSVNRTWAADQPLNGCDPVLWGLQSYDKDGKRLWQHVIAAFGKPAVKSLGKSGKGGADPYYDGCWAPGQYEIFTPETFGPVLKDDALFTYIGNSVLRIRLQDGFPARMPPNVSIMNYAGVMRLKEVLNGAAYERFSLLTDAPKDDENRLRAITYEYGFPNDYFAIQDYFFPQLAGKRYPRNVEKSHHSSK